MVRTRSTASLSVPVASRASTVTVDLEDPFPLTPALSPWERETIGGAGNGFSEYRQSATSYSLSSGERVRVRGNSMPACIAKASRAVRRPALCLVAMMLTAPAAQAQSAPAATPLTWSRKAGCLALVQADQVVWQFNYGTNATKPCFHPVALPGGPVLTWDASAGPPLAPRPVVLVEIHRRSQLLGTGSQDRSLPGPHRMERATDSHVP